MDLKLSESSALAGFHASSSGLAGVIVSERVGLGIASVQAQKYQSSVLAELVRDHFAIELPRGPHRVAAGDLAFLGVGPEAWLAIRECDGRDFVSSIREALGNTVSVSDQSDGYVVLRISGPNVRETLCKLVPIDLHPRAFSVEDVAVTSAAHIGATLWRLADTVERSAVFELAVFRSFAVSLWRALCESAAEFGLDVAESTPTPAGVFTNASPGCTAKSTCQHGVVEYKANDQSSHLWPSASRTKLQCRAPRLQSSVRGESL